MSGYNFFNYNPGGGLSLPPPPQQYGGGGGGGGGGPKRGQCSAPGCRNGHLEIRYKCQNCQNPLHYECTHNRDDQGHCWCPYDCSSTANTNLNQMVNPQLIQLQQMQQQHHQPMQQQMQQHPQQQQQQQSHLQHQQQPQPFLFGGNMGGNLNQQQQQNLNQQLQQGIQQHQQQLHNQAQQFQQLAASVQGGPPVPGIVDDPTGLVGAMGDPGGVVDPNSDLAAFDRVGNLNKQGGPMVGDEDDEDDEDHALDDADSEEEDDDDDDDDDDDVDDYDLLPPHQRGKRTAVKAGATKAKGGRRPRDPNRLTRRQQPPKTNITRTRYSNDFKMRVVSEVEQPGYGTLADISKHYGVAEQTLRDWVKNKDKIQQAVIRRGNLKANPVDYLKHVTQALLKFMDERQQMGIDQPVTARMIAAKGEEIKNKILSADAQSPFLTENERKFTKKFSASLSWGKKWVRQYGRSRKPTQVPADLEDLPKEELVRLLRSVASEREILERNAAGGTGKDSGHDDLGRRTDAAVQSPKASAGLLPFIPSPPRVKPPPAFKCDQVKAHIAEMAASLIKKKGHNWKGRPTTEVTEEIPSLEAARELFKGYPEINKTARSYRWNLTGKQVVEWLGCPKFVHPVKFEGKVICQIGQPAYVYAFAGYDSLLAKYEQGTGTLTLKFKTFTAGTGNIPGSDEPVFLCNEPSS